LRGHLPVQGVRWGGLKEKRKILRCYCDPKLHQRKKFVKLHVIFFLVLAPGLTGVEANTMSYLGVGSF
jgi:hypothetical protein